MTPAELDRYRMTLTNDAKARDRLVDILSRLREVGCTLTEEALKRVPKGFDVPKEQETLLKRKGLVARTNSTSLGDCDDHPAQPFIYMVFVRYTPLDWVLAGPRKARFRMGRFV